MNTEIKYEIVPYESVGPILFGMSKREVAAIFGKPDITEKDFIGRVVELRNELSIKYNKAGKVNEVTFSDGANVHLNGISIFNHDDALSRLNDIEKPFNTVGYKVYFLLGIAITGFSKKKDSKTLSVFARELEPLWRA